jgi:hypothetical protein
VIWALVYLEDVLGIQNPKSNGHAENFILAFIPGKAACNGSFFRIIL